VRGHVRDAAPVIPKQVNLKTAVEKAGQGCAALILLGDGTPNRSHRISPTG